MIGDGEGKCKEWGKAWVSVNFKRTKLC